MNIFISGNPLKTFTSGTPQRGLIKALVKLKPDYRFTIHVSDDDEARQLDGYWNELKVNSNVNIKFITQSQRNINIKKLIGLRNYQQWPAGYDLYFSPGMPENFANINKPGISTVADLSSINFPTGSSLKWHGNRIFKNTLNLAVKHNSLVGAISNFTKKELIKRYPKKADKFFIIYNGIEDFWFDDIYEENELTRKYRERKYFIWWGFGSNRKNLERLLTAYIKLRKFHKNLPELLLIGKISEDLTKVKRLINSDSAHIHLIQFQEPYILKEFVKNSKGLLFPSLYEGFGLPIIETYSQGKPVLYSNRTSMPEVASSFGISANPFNISSIQDGLIKLMNYNITDKYIEEVKTYSQKFTYEIAARQFSEITNNYKNNKLFNPLFMCNSIGFRQRITNETP